MRQPVKCNPNGINIDSVKELIRDYSKLDESITMNELIRITGFNYWCIVCKGSEGDCDKCVYYNYGNMNLNCLTHNSYINLKSAKSSKAIYRAIQARIRYLTKLVKLYNKTNNIIDDEFDTECRLRQDKQNRDRANTRE